MRDPIGLLHGYLSASAARRPDEIALVTADERLSYAEIDVRSSALALALAHALGDALARLRTRVALRRAAEVGHDVSVWGTVWIHGSGRVRVGHGVTFNARAAPIELHAGAGSEIRIGPGARIDGGTSIEAQRSVSIGARAHVGPFCKILDNNFHRVTDRDERPASIEVVVEDDADLGPRAILLPGAHVGRGTILQAGTVLSRRVPEGVIVAGQPPLIRRAA
ncbi:MAG: hypothetical protein U0359_07335 [Byssovorax sp.]